MIAHPSYFGDPSPEILFRSGDIYIGDQSDEVNPFNDEGGETWYFQGHTIVDAVIRDVTKGKQISHFVLTGCSAGGVGTFFTCDYVAEMLVGTGAKARTQRGLDANPISPYVTYIWVSKVSYVT